MYSDRFAVCSVLFSMTIVGDEETCEIFMEDQIKIQK